MGPGAWLARALGISEHAGLGLFFVICVASIWVAASFIVQDIEEEGVHPAVLTYTANSLFAIYLPIYYVKEWLAKRIQPHRTVERGGEDVESESLVVESTGRGNAPNADLRPSSGPGVGGIEAKSVAVHSRTSVLQILHAALVVAPLWYLAQLTFNASLRSTSVTSNTLLSSTAVLFTYLLSVVVLGEHFALWKLGCIALLMGGSSSVTLADVLASTTRSGARSTLSGNALCLLSAVLYGAYTVTMRRMLGEDEGTSVLLFFGFMGTAIFLGVGLLLPISKLLLGATLGTLRAATFGEVVLKGLLDNVLSDYLWARAILLIGPTLATAGLALQVPLAVVADALLKSPAWLRAPGPFVLTALGGAAILAGFLVMTLRKTEDSAEGKHEIDAVADELAHEI